MSTIVSVDQQGISGTIRGPIQIFTFTVATVATDDDAEFVLKRESGSVVMRLWVTRAGARWNADLGGPLIALADNALEWTTEPPTEVRVVVNPWASDVDEAP